MNVDFQLKLLDVLGIKDERVLCVRLCMPFRGDMLLTLEVGDDAGAGSYIAAFGNRVVTTYRNYHIRARDGRGASHLARALLAAFGVRCVLQPAFALSWDDLGPRLELENLSFGMERAAPSEIAGPAFWELLPEFQALPLSSAATPMVPSLPATPR